MASDRRFKRSDFQPLVFAQLQQGGESRLASAPGKEQGRTEIAKRKANGSLSCDRAGHFHDWQRRHRLPASTGAKVKRLVTIGAGQNTGPGCAMENVRLRMGADEAIPVLRGCDRVKETGLAGTRGKLPARKVAPGLNQIRLGQSGTHYAGTVLTASRSCATT